MSNHILQKDINFVMRRLVGFLGFTMWNICALIESQKMCKVTYNLHGTMRILGIL